MAAQEAENTAYGIIYFLYITAQGRSDEPRTKSCSAKASTILESQLHRAEGIPTNKLRVRCSQSL